RRGRNSWSGYHQSLDGAPLLARFGSNWSQDSATVHPAKVFLDSRVEKPAADDCGCGRRCSPRGLSRQQSAPTLSPVPSESVVHHEFGGSYDVQPPSLGQWRSESSLGCGPASTVV